MDIERIIKLSTVRSKITGKEYKPSNVVPITDLVQAAAYIENRVIPVDIYLSKDSDTNKVRLVFLFDKRESYEVFQLWRKHELEYTIKSNETDKVSD